MKAKITILGCGNSTGIPAIGNHWGDCDPHEPKNTRTRSSLCIQTETTTIVVDTGPDFRNQLNREDIQTIDAALYTHHHGDHINGMDELRIIRHKNKNLVPIYGNTETLKNLEHRFHYLFRGGDSDLYPIILTPTIIEQKTYNTPFTIGDITITPFEQDHGTLMSLGYRFGDLGYSVDMVNIDQTAINTLKGIKTWIVDAAGYKDNANKVHASLDKIITLNQQIGAQQVYLSSLSLPMDYQTLCKELPSGYKPAHDGLQIECQL